MVKIAYFVVREDCVMLGTVIGNTVTFVKMNFFKHCRGKRFISFTITAGAEVKIYRVCLYTQNCLNNY